MNSNNVDLQAQDWMKTLVAHCDQAFPKIRIRAKHIKRSEASDLIDKRNKLLKTKTDDSKEVTQLTEKIASILEEEGRSKAYRFRKYCDKGNTLNVTEMWKLKKKIWPKKASALPVAKRDHGGKLVSAPEDLKRLLQKEYKERLRPRPYQPDMKIAKKLRKRLIQIKMKISKKTKSRPFTMEDLEKVLKNTKTGKSRDPTGISREIFSLPTIGSNLKESLLTMCNSIKEQGVIPKFMQQTTITTIPKKGPRTKLKNERGVFLVNSVRGIFMRMLFNTETDMIEN